MSLSKSKHNDQDGNLLVRGIIEFIQHYEDNATADFKTRTLSTMRRAGLTQNDVPKRYATYAPMLLLGPNFETYKPAWEAVWTTLSDSDKQALWSCVVQSFQRAGQMVSVVAMNAPITSTLRHADSNGQSENVMRSPSGLRPLFGCFGPDHLLSNSERGDQQPEQADFEAALWVEAVQLDKIVQIWAPRWTMFSRGNIKEKERILNGVTALSVDDTRLIAESSKPRRQTFAGLSVEELGQEVSRVDVIDFYVGIGYFAFSYLKRGVRRVWGWDINGWSVEGLRRGCERNKWKCLVVKVGDEQREHEEAVQQVVTALKETVDLRCIVFRGNNKWALPIMNAIQKSCAARRDLMNLRHCNLGLLPTSQGSWNGAVALLDRQRGGWLHVHENAEIQDVDRKKQEVLQTLREISAAQDRAAAQISCQYVQMVKTFAPGVGHYVFDVKIEPMDPT